MTNSIDSTYLLSNYQNQTKSSGSSSLGKDDFLKILMTQLQNQDPLNPMQDQDFISQMATFSSLEQMTNLNSSMDNFVKSAEQNQFMQASSMIGKTVTYLDDQDNQMTAVVKSVLFKDGSTNFQLNDDNQTSVTSGQITKIE
ncbi:flagellar hook assembly protein FlgD [Neobacillus sp. PS3-12]|jgi:flagellar basal-body rod modification protein FlgD|uniref:flagellar hook assembly protein FlgD n=1 Tax=Neobacillus sp. PS3-12 TaxID=3070677 RepID=UPI0027E13168|nr:flagellar hook assembly protein FlgD [Neobacillus sp. PS3-12]WML52003.1 flagellar hook assembly protein FlgD [Neobacillus sp. PS3-12]